MLDVGTEAGTVTVMDQTIVDACSGIAAVVPTLGDVLRDVVNDVSYVVAEVDSEVTTSTHLYY